MDAAPDLYDLEEFVLTKDQKARCFNSPVSKEKIDALVEQRVPANTKRNTSWSMSVWRAWCKARGLSANIETTSSAAELNRHLKSFIVEANRQDGSTGKMALLTHPIHSI